MSNSEDPIIRDRNKERRLLKIVCYWGAAIVALVYIGTFIYSLKQSKNTFHSNVIVNIKDAMSDTLLHDGFYYLHDSDLEKAMSVVRAADGGSIYFPSGTYQLVKDYPKNEVSFLDTNKIYCVTCNGDLDTSLINDSAAIQSALNAAYGDDPVISGGYLIYDLDIDSVYPTIKRHVNQNGITIGEHSGDIIANGSVKNVYNGN